MRKGQNERANDKFGVGINRRERKWVEEGKQMWEPSCMKLKRYLKIVLPGKVLYAPQHTHTHSHTLPALLSPFSLLFSYTLFDIPLHPETHSLMFSPVYILLYWRWTIFPLCIVPKNPLTKAPPTHRFLFFAPG